MTVSLVPGSVIAGRYRLDRLIGEGGMGQVWAATHAVTQRTTALKFLRGPTHLRPELRHRFLREARAASAVNHPNVVQIHDFFELEDGTPVMVMDLLEGETLGQRLARVGSLSLRDAADILLPVTSAVGAAHALGIVHRDLKPDNAFLARSPTGGLDVRVLDFGIAKLMTVDAADLGALTDTGTMLGTPCYMSPEQAFGEKDLDHRTDIWAIGVMLYEALSGTRPVDGDNMGQVVKRLMTDGITPIQVLVPDLPADVVALVGGMLSRDREGRPKDLRAVSAVLARYAGVQAPPFEAAISERPLVADSDSQDRLNTPRAIIRGPGTSDPEAATSSSPRVGAPGLVDTQGAQSISVPRGSARRSASLAVVVVVVIALVIVVGRLLLGSAPAERSAAADHVPAPAAPAPVEVPAVATPEPHVEAAPSAAIPALAESTPAPAVSPSSVERTRRNAPHGDHAHPPIPSALPAAATAPAAPKPNAPGARGGLVDEPPF